MPLRAPRSPGAAERAGPDKGTIMNFAEPFIRRPVATTLLVVSILIFGAMSYRLLPVSDLPTVDFPTIQVNANLPGASPETMASAVAHAAREAVLDDFRRDLDELEQLAGAARTSPCSSTSAATSMRPPRTCSR